MFWEEFFNYLVYFCNIKSDILMKKFNYASAIIVLSIIFSSCEWMYEQDKSTLEFSFINNSTDTIGCSTFFHYTKDLSNVVRYQSGYLINPSDTLRRWWVYPGDGTDPSWGAFFKKEKIDTIYIYVLSTIPTPLNPEFTRCHLPVGPHVLKVYKFYEGNFDMTSVSPVFSYP